MTIPYAKRVISWYVLFYPISRLLVEYGLVSF